MVHSDGIYTHGVLLGELIHFGTEQLELRTESWIWSYDMIDVLSNYREGREKFVIVIVSCQVIKKWSFVAWFVSLLGRKCRKLSLEICSCTGVIGLVWSDPVYLCSSPNFASLQIALLLPLPLKLILHPMWFAIASNLS